MGIFFWKLQPLVRVPIGQAVRPTSKKGWGTTILGGLFI